MFHLSFICHAALVELLILGQRVVNLEAHLGRTGLLLAALDVCKAQALERQ